MSGGSHNYLCRMLEAPWAAEEATVAAMERRLLELNAQDAAVELRRWWVDYKALETRAQVAHERLFGVLKAVEWLDSGDRGPENVAKALEEYRGMITKKAAMARIKRGAEVVISAEDIEREPEEFYLHSNGQVYRRSSSG